MATCIDAKIWSWHAFSADNGYPRKGTFYQGRLFLANTTSQPNTIWSSKVGDYERFSHTEKDGTVVADSGFNLTLDTDQVNEIRFIKGSKHLQVGTSGGPFIISSGSENLALTPTNATAVRDTADGTANIDPYVASQATLYVDKDKRKIRELAYDYQIDGYSTPDLTLIAEHITGGKIKRIAYSRAPDRLLWVLLENGQLRGLTYEREQNVIAWHRHRLGDDGVNNAVINDITVIPSADETHDQLYLSVSRGTIHTIDVMEDIFDVEGGDTLTDAFYLDSAIESKAPFSLDQFAVNLVDGTTTCSLTADYLVGKTVSVVTDGVVHPDVTILPHPQSTSFYCFNIERAPTQSIIVGYKYGSRAKLLDPAVNTDSGSSQGRTKRVESVTIRMSDTVGLKVGQAPDKVDSLEFRESGDEMGTISLFSGDKRKLIDFDPERQLNIELVHDVPLPCTILSLVYALSVSKR